MGINNNSIITPENLNKIVIQYELPQNGFQPGIPSFVLYYGTPERQQQAILAEIKNYIQYLQIRANIEGKELVAIQDGKKKTIITVGNETGGGYPVIVNLATSPDNPCIATPQLKYINHAGAFIVGDVLYNDDTLLIPTTGYDLIENISTGLIYSLNTLTGVIGALTGNNCSIPPSPTTPATINFKLNGVDFSNANGNNLTGVENITSITGQKTANANNIPCIVNFIIPQRGFDNIYQDYDSASFTDCYVEATKSGSNWNVILTYNGVGGSVNIDIINAVAVNQNVIKLSNKSTNGNYDYISSYPFTGVGGVDSMVVGGTYKQLQTQNINSVCGKVQGIAGNIYHIITASPFATGFCVVKFLLNGSFVSTKTYTNSQAAPNFDIVFSDLPAYADYDEIEFEFIDGGGGAGIPVGARVAVLEAGVCAAPANGFFTVDGTLNAGNVVYTDIAMTVPLAGYNFIVSDTLFNNEPISNINNITGVIGAVTGNNCP